MKLQRGSIALCSRNQLGLVLSEGPVKTFYRDGTESEAWTGIHLDPTRLDEPWSSRAPLVVTHVENLVVVAEEVRAIHIHAARQQAESE